MVTKIAVRSVSDQRVRRLNGVVLFKVVVESPEARYSSLLRAEVVLSEDVLTFH